MINLNNFRPDEIASFGKTLLATYRNQGGSFEEIARTCVREIYDTFQDGQGGRAFALVRIFRIT